MKTMRKYKLLAISLLLLSTKISAQPKPFCVYLECFSANTSLLNSCEDVRLYARITNTSTLTFPVLTVTLDFGDGSTPTATTYPSFAPGTIYPENTHAYALPGTYIASLTIAGGGGTLITNCVVASTVQIDVTGICETCSTYTVLSTGYDPGTAAAIPVASLTPGGPDPNWLVFRSYSLTPTTNTPVPGSVFNYASTQANVIYPKDGYCPAPLGQSRYISVNTDYHSVYGVPNIYTYRRYFDLPNPLPASSMYSLLMSVFAGDYLFDVQINGGSIIASGLPNPDGSLSISANSCSGFFRPDSNFIDITVAADVNAAVMQFDAEIMLYECPAIVPCPPGVGATTSWNWSTNWGSGWFYSWSSWYCMNFAPAPGVSCPPPAYVCPGCSGGGGGGGGGGSSWGWVLISGWGWVWTYGSSSGSGSITCPTCIPSFAPIPGNKYLISAWVKEKNAPQSKTSYTYPGITVLYPSAGGSSGPFIPDGNIIDGWQRIEAEFTIPGGATDMTVKLECTSNDCYYDDIRILPFDGSLKSYVYDPVNLRLVAELDERNYATLYEYDEEGKLIRIKKETEKGKMTIKENRNNTKK
jgi:hypothetical protein